jgi:hypothetical protein
MQQRSCYKHKYFKEQQQLVSALCTHNTKFNQLLKLLKSNSHASGNLYPQDESCKFVYSSSTSSLSRIILNENGWKT